MRVQEGKDSLLFKEPETESLPMPQWICRLNKLDFLCFNFDFKVIDGRSQEWGVNMEGLENICGRVHDGKFLKNKYIYYIGKKSAPTLLSCTYVSHKVSQSFILFYHNTVGLSYYCITFFSFSFAFFQSCDIFIYFYLWIHINKWNIEIYLTCIILLECMFSGRNSLFEG